MKNYLLTVVALLMFFGIGAQNAYEKEMPMSLGNQNAFVVELEGANKKMAENAWSDYLEDYGKVKRNRKADEYYCEECKITLINMEPMQVTMKLDERRDMTMLYAFFDTGSFFVSADTDESLAISANKFMYNFSLEVKKRVIGEELKAQEKILKSLNKDQGKLEKQNEGYHNDIDKAKKAIVEAEENIEQNLKDQESKQLEIKNQMKIIEEVTERLNNVGKN